MRPILWLNVARNSNNEGDVITSESFERTALAAYREDVVSVPTHLPMGVKHVPTIVRSGVVVLAGSNILSSHMERQRLWRVPALVRRALRKRVVLCGVGWWSYEHDPCRYTRRWLRQVLHPTFPHSVRDQYTAGKLAALGFNVSFTSCTSTWGLPADLIQNYRATEAVVTVTDYGKSAAQDRAWIESLSRHYERLVLVPMGPGDEAYFRGELDMRHLRIGKVGLAGLREELPGRHYVGTRLHAGIFALQYGVPSLILAIDNRSIELCGDINLPHVSRSVAAAGGTPPVLDHFPRSIALPKGAIQNWLNQWHIHVAAHSRSR